MAFRAAGRGYRVHVLQFMKGGAASVEDVRGEYNAIAAMPGLTYENLGHYGWHAMPDGSDDRDHAAEAAAGLDRVREFVDAAAVADLSTPFALDSDPDEGVHMLVLDEVLYAAERGLVAPDDVCELVDDAPGCLELVLTGGHERPEYLHEHAELVTNVRKEAPPDGGRAAGAKRRRVLNRSTRKPPADGRLTRDGPRHKTLNGPPRSGDRRMGGRTLLPLCAHFPDRHSNRSVSYLT
jgi:cob(I)alamin adenosyltransferase